MTFVYPAVFTPHKEDKGYHVDVIDLETCEADGPDLEDALEYAKDAAYDWICLEIEEGGDLPPQTHVEDIELEEGCFVRQLQITVKLMPDND